MYCYIFLWLRRLCHNLLGSWDERITKLYKEESYLSRLYIRYSLVTRGDALYVWIHWYGCVLNHMEDHIPCENPCLCTTALNVVIPPFSGPYENAHKRPDRDRGWPWYRPSCCWVPTSCGVLGDFMDIYNCNSNLEESLPRAARRGCHGLKYYDCLGRLSSRFELQLYISMKYPRTPHEVGTQ